VNKIRQTAYYLIADYLAAIASWYLLFVYRKEYIEAAKHGYAVAIGNDNNLIAGLLVLPFCWLGFYTFTGYYKDIFRRSRFNEFWQTLFHTSLGVLVVFLILILDDSVSDYKDYYRSGLVLLVSHFGLTLTGRLLIASGTIRKVQQRKIGFNTVLVGSGPSAAKLYRELEEAPRSEGFLFKGYVAINEKDHGDLAASLKKLGGSNQLREIIASAAIEEVLIAVEEDEHQEIPAMVNMLQNEFVRLKILPDAFSMVVGLVKMNNVLGAILLEVDFEVMPVWQKSAKRLFDIVFSLMAITAGSPVLLIIALLVKMDSKGPVFYRQERIGYKGKPFYILKFRSMRTDAEKSGPRLSSEDDPRITRTGKLLRKTRLDEIPQFINVLMGEMSVVGPRPERQFFIDQIMVKAPYYRRLHRVKPGITSWGQVKYGYAENVDQMLERLRYDMLYLENMSLALDLKILLYTVLIMVQGRGK